MFKEILRDMTMHAPDAHLLLDLDLFKSKRCLKVHNTSDHSGPAISGLAMASLRKRATAIGAELDVQYHPGGESVMLLIQVR